MVYKTQLTKSAPTEVIAQQYQRRLYIVEKYFQCATNPLLPVRVYLYSFSRCCLPNMPTSAKFRENLNLPQFKVIQGRWYEFLLVINSNCGPIFHRFWDTATNWLKIAYFSYPSFIRRPRSLSPLWNFTVKLSVRKLESWGYSVVKVVWSQLQLSLTDPPVWRTDRQTDRWTDWRAMAYSAL